MLEDLYQKVGEISQAQKAADDHREILFERMEHLDHCLDQLKASVAPAIQMGHDWQWVKDRAFKVLLTIGFLIMAGNGAGETAKDWISEALKTFLK